MKSSPGLGEKIVYRLRLLLAGLVLILAALTTGCAGVTPRPPGPLPTPTPPPAPSMAVHFERGRFVLADGTDVRLLGSIVGCYLEEPGWPLVCIAALDALQAAGLNWTHIRTGQFSVEGEAPQFAFYLKAPNGKYDLTKINQAFLDLTRSTCVAAKQRLIYCEVDIPADRWVRQHGAADQPAIDPLSARNNVQGEEHGGLGIFQLPPDAVQIAAIKAIAGAVCDLDNVILSTGNEAFKSDSLAWETPVVALLRQVCPGRSIGINSSSSSAGDFTIVHQSSASLVRGVEVNEIGDDIPPEETINQALIADRVGSYFMYWKGSDSATQWLDTIKKLGQIRAGHPPPPVACQPPPEDGQWRVVCKARADVAGTDPVCTSGDQKSGVLAAAESKAAADNPALFTGSCLITLNETNLLSGMDAIISALRSAGECVGRKSDSIFIKRADGNWQEEHPEAWRTGCFTQVNQAFKYVWTHP